MTGDCRVFKCIRQSVDGKHLIHLQNETSISEFLWLLFYIEK